MPYEDTGTTHAYEEVPHVAQFRDKGFLGLMGESLGHFGEEAMHGLTDPNILFLDKINPFAIQKRLYGDEHSHEGFHGDEGQKRDLFNEILGEGAYKQYRGWPYSGEGISPEGDMGKFRPENITYGGEQFPPTDSIRSGTTNEEGGLFATKFQLPSDYYSGNLWDAPIPFDESSYTQNNFYNSQGQAINDPTVSYRSSDGATVNIMKPQGLRN